MRAVRSLVKGTSRMTSGFCETCRPLTMPARLKFLTASPGTLVCLRGGQETLPDVRRKTEGRWTRFQKS